MAGAGVGMPPKMLAVAARSVGPLTIKASIERIADLMEKEDEFIFVHVDVSGIVKYRCLINSIYIYICTYT